jgi:hypothetical protein
MTNSLSKFGPWLLVAYGLFTIWMPLWFAVRRGALQTMGM